MNSGIYGPFYNTDVRGTIWSLWWLRYSAVHYIDYNNCYFLAAPFGVNFSFLPVLGISFLISKLMVVFTGYILSVNLSTLILFALTGCFTYLLCYHLTEDKEASFISGFIFAFCPYHLNKVMEFTYVFLGAGVVLYIWALLKLREKSSSKIIFLAAFAYIFTLTFNPYYGFFVIIFTIGLFIFCLFYQFKNKLSDLNTGSGRKKLFKNALLSLSFIRDVAIVFFFAILMNAPSLWNIAKRLFSSNYNLAEKASMGYVRSFEYLFAQSARLLSYLLPASTHPIFGEFTKKMFGSIFYGRGSIEQTLYLGWVPLLLSYFAFRRWRFKRSHGELFPEYQSSRENFYIGFFIFSACFAFICSMPPYIDLLFFKVYFPSYFIYKVLPMFRAYARFGVLVILSISVLAGFGLKFFFERIKNTRHKQLFAAGFCLFILFEFTNIPPFRVTDISKVPSVYKWLGEQNGDFIVAEYPIAMTSPGEAFENYDYLFYQTKHQKRLLNGAVAGTEAFEIRKKILKINDPETINILKRLGVKYVILHTDLYKEGDYGNAVDVVGEIPRLDNIAGWDLIKTFGSVYVYNIGNKPWREKIDAS
jgi:hypothetical protein